MGTPNDLWLPYRTLGTGRWEAWVANANACTRRSSSLSTPSMRLAKLDQNTDGREPPVALAKVCFEPMGNGSIQDPALRNTGVRFVGASPQSAPGSSMGCRGSLRPRYVEDEQAWSGAEISCVLQIVEERRGRTGAVVHQSRCVGCRFVSRCPRWDRQSSDFWGTSLLISRLSTQANMPDRLKV